MKFRMTIWGGPVVVASLLLAGAARAQTSTVAFSQTNYVATLGATNITINLVRNGDTTTIGSVAYATSNGSATNGLDYVGATGTVSFAVGSTTGSFTIKILTNTTRETTGTVNLSLSNPTGLTLGSPSQAVLSLPPQGPPKLAFRLAQQFVHRHAGKTVVSVARLGDASGSASVHYATSDGTAINGVHYRAAAGTLVFFPGDTNKTFRFPIIDYHAFDSNRTVNIALTNPTGASLGAPSNSVVTIVNDRPQIIRLTDFDGDAVTLRLLNAGTMAVTQTGTALDLQLSATDATSQLLVQVRRAGGGDGRVRISSLTGDGGAQLIAAPAADLVGSGIQLGDWLGAVQVHDILNEAAIGAGGVATQNTTIVAHDIQGGVINVGSRIRRLTTARFNGTIMAPRIGTLGIFGNARQHIPGDFAGTITLTSANATSNGYALGELFVAGMITNSVITTTTGGVWSVTASRMIDSMLLVGFTPADPPAPFAGGEFVPDLFLWKFQLTAARDAFVNSFLVAPRLGYITFNSVATSNGGTACGVLAGQSIHQLGIGRPRFRWDPAGANDQAVGDFHVIH
jgi:hypothetical protein